MAWDKFFDTPYDDARSALRNRGRMRLDCYDEAMEELKKLSAAEIERLLPELRSQDDAVAVAAWRRIAAPMVARGQAIRGQRQWDLDHQDHNRWVED